MTNPVPETLCLIAGRGVYPLLLASSARTQGVRRIVAIAFRRETSPKIATLADEVHWISLGQFGAMLKAMRASGAKHAVMAGQITPTHLFRVRLDAPMLALLKKLRARNAETIFGAVGDELRAIGIDLVPASSFMEAHMPAPGVLSARAPREAEATDVALGLRVAKLTSGLDVGQTVVLKQGTILAVEAFEGTDEAIRRAGKLGGPGTVVVKVAKCGHDMRFDIPVIGLRTMRMLRKIKAAGLAVEAGRAILLEREAIVAEVNRLGMFLTAEETRDNEIVTWMERERR